VYEKFFGFQKRPFDLVPDPDFLFLGESHDSALANLLSGIESEKGFIVITGGVGTGKTTILRAVLRRLGRELDVAFLNQPDLDDGELLRTILHEFDFPAQSEDKVALRGQLRAFLEQREQPAILVIDEAHILGEEALEQVRLLSNFELNDRKLLQIVLAGQPELKQLLSRPRLRPLAQRIEMFYEIQPLTLNESKAYIQRRIQIAGNPDDLVFEPRALDAIYERTGGVPRLINLLAERTLITAYVAESKTITARMVREAYEDLGEVTQRVMRVPEPESPQAQEILAFEPSESSPAHFSGEEPRKKRPMRRIERWIAGLGIGGIVAVVILSIGWDGAFGSRSGNSKNAVSAHEPAATPATESKDTESKDMKEPAKKELAKPAPTPPKTQTSTPGAGELESAKTERAQEKKPESSKAALPSLEESLAKKREAERSEQLRIESERAAAAASARVREAAPPQNVRYAIQCGSFREREQAEELAESVASILGRAPQITTVETGAGPVHRVLAGTYSTRQEAFEELGPLRRSHGSLILQILEIPAENTQAPSTSKE